MLEMVAITEDTLICWQFVMISFSSMVTAVHSDVSGVEGKVCLSGRAAFDQCDRVVLGGDEEDLVAGATLEI